MAWPALTIAAIVSMTRPGKAEPPGLPLELEWEAPEDCPDSSAVRRRIERILRAPMTDPNSAVARGKIVRRGDGGFHLAMTVRTGDVEDARAIDATSCAALAGAFAVVVALAIDPTKDAADPEGDELPATEASVPTEPAAPAPPARQRKRESAAPPPTPRSPWASRFAFGLGGSVVWGPLPEVSPGVVGSILVREGRFRVGAIATFSLPQSPRFDGSAGASFDMVQAGAVGAYMVPIGVFAIGPAVNVEATYLHVRGFGIRKPWATSAVWPTGVLGARVEARPARWLGLFARADILVATDAPRISLSTPTDGVRLHTPATVSPRMSLGAELVFP